MTVQAALWLVRGLHFGAVALLCGGGGLAWLIDATGSSSARVPRGAAVVAWVSGVAWLAVTLIAITAEAESLLDPESWSAFFASSFGPPWTARLALLTAGAVIAITRPRRSTMAGLALVGAALAIDQAWLGHAAAATGAIGVVARTADALHVMAAYAWVGALPMLCLVLRDPDRAKPARALALFSSIGVFAVAAILASGLVNAAMRIGALSQLLSTSYGRILGVKITLFAAMVVLAFINRTLATRPRALRGLALGVVIETSLGFSTLAVAALLGINEPPMP